MGSDVPALDANRLRGVLLARAEGHRDALHETFGAAAQRPPVHASLDLPTLPATPHAFAARVFPWSASVRVLDGDRILLVHVAAETDGPTTRRTADEERAVDVCRTVDGERAVDVCRTVDHRSWRLPGGPGRAREPMAEGAERLAREDAGVDVAVTGLTATRLIEFDVGDVSLPVLHACFTAEPIDPHAPVAATARWFHLDDLPANVRDRPAVTATFTDD